MALRLEPSSATRTVQRHAVEHDRHKHSPLVVRELIIDRPAQGGGDVAPLGGAGRVESEAVRETVPVLAVIATVGRCQKWRPTLVDTSKMANCTPRW